MTMIISYKDLHSIRFKKFNITRELYLWSLNVTGVWKPDPNKERKNGINISQERGLQWQDYG